MRARAAVLSASRSLVKLEQQPCFAALLPNLSSRTNGSRDAARTPTRLRGGHKNAPGPLLRVSSAKANIGGGAALKLYILCLCSWSSRTAAVAALGRAGALASPGSSPPSERVSRAKRSNVSCMLPVGGQRVAGRGPAGPGPSQCGSRDQHGRPLTAHHRTHAFTKHLRPLTPPTHLDLTRALTFTRASKVFPERP